MKNLNLKTLKFDRNLDSHVDSPFIEKNGWLEFNPKFIEPEFLTTWTFETHLYDEQVAIDHFVITFPSRTELEKYAESFYPFGAKIVEGPDLFPINFCSTNINVPSDLWLHLMTLLMPAGGLVVLDAPHAAGDQAAGKPILIKPECARLTQQQVGSHRMGWFSFQPLYDMIVRREPDLLD